MDALQVRECVDAKPTVPGRSSWLDRVFLCPPRDSFVQIGHDRCGGVHARVDRLLGSTRDTRGEKQSVPRPPPTVSCHSDSPWHWRRPGAMRHYVAPSATRPVLSQQSELTMPPWWSALTTVRAAQQNSPTSVQNNSGSCKPVVGRHDGVHSAPRYRVLQTGGSGSSIFRHGKPCCSILRLDYQRALPILTNDVVFGSRGLSQY